MKFTSIALTLILATLTLLTGCKNTAAGIGEDMQANGKAIQKSAQSR